MTWRNENLVSFRGAVPGFSDGADSPRRFLERCLERIAEREPTLKAFVTLNVEGARAAADAASERHKMGRPLSAIDGCPVAVKDIIETRDMPTQLNSPAFVGRHTHRDAACVSALRAGGAVILGKTVTTEFAIGFSGPTTNPFDQTRTPGGSSSGSAASVGAGEVPLAFGTQTNGSHIRPASYCGIYGFKGTLGLIPTGGVHPLSTTLDHVGLYGGSLDDVWAATSFISASIGNPGFVGLERAEPGAPAPVKPKRLARLHLDAWDEVDPATKDVFEAQVAAFADDGIEIVDRETSRELAEMETRLDAEVNGNQGVLAYELRWPFRDYVDQHGDKIGERIRNFLKDSDAITPADYAALLETRARNQAMVRDALDAVGADAFIMPSASGPAPKGFEFTGSRAYLIYWSWLGFPAFSLPLMAVDGMPLGLQLMQAGGRDRALAQTAAYLAGGR